MLTIARVRQTFGLLVLTMSTGAIADTISTLPPDPTAADNFRIVVSGVTGFSPSGGRVHGLAVQGSVIRLEGCVNPGGFAVPGSYVISYPPIVLPVGTYLVQYWVALCDSAEQALSPFVQTATASLTVSAGIPALNDYLLILTGAILLAIGLLRVRNSRPGAKG